MILLSILVFGFAWLTMARITTLFTWSVGEKYTIPTRETRHHWDESKIEYETVVWSFPMFGSFEKVKEIHDDYVSCLYAPLHLAKLNVFLWPLVLPHTVYRLGLRALGFGGKTTGNIVGSVVWGNMTKGINSVAAEVAKPIKGGKK